MSNEINSPLLRSTVAELDEISIAVKDHQITIPEANARITAIKHKIQSVALDWLYSKKMIGIEHKKTFTEKLDR